MKTTDSQFKTPDSSSEKSGDASAIDTSRPSPEELREAFALAKCVWDEAPWERLDERQVLAVHFADGQSGFVSVMGVNGQHRAISVYPSFAAYLCIRSIDERHEDSFMDAFFSVSQLQLAFLPAANLPKGAMADMRASGVRFKRGMNPSFESYVAGFMTDRMGGRELRRYVAFLKAFRAFCERHGSESIICNDAPNKMLTTWTEDSSGNWAKGENDYSPMLPVAVRMDEDLLARVAALPVRENFSLEIGAFVIPMGQAPNGRGKMSRLVMLVDVATQMILGAEPVETSDARGLDWTPIVDMVFEKLCELGSRPKAWATTAYALRGILKGLSRSSLTGTAYDSGSSCECVRDSFEFLRRRMFW
jgi:hypothetical protein